MDETPSVGAAPSSGPVWPQMVISVVIAGIWAGTLLLQELGHPLLAPDDSALLRNLVVLVAGYWLGSSIGSARKDNRVPAEASPKPTVVVKTT